MAMYSYNQLTIQQYISVDGGFIDSVQSENMKVVDAHIVQYYRQSCPRQFKVAEGKFRLPV